jgi:hypothetical protein
LALAAMVLRQHLSLGLVVIIPSLEPSHHLVVAVVVQLLALQMLSRTDLVADLVAVVLVFQQLRVHREQELPDKVMMVALVAPVPLQHRVLPVVVAQRALA